MYIKYDIASNYDGSVILTGGLGGILRSQDKGVTWVNCYPGIHPRKIAINQ